MNHNKINYFKTLKYEDFSIDNFLRLATEFELTLCYKG